MPSSRTKDFSCDKHCRGLGAQGSGVPLGLEEAGFSTWGVLMHLKQEERETERERERESESQRERERDTEMYTLKVPTFGAPERWLPIDPVTSPMPPKRPPGISTFAFHLPIGKPLETEASHRKDWEV